MLITVGRYLNPLEAYIVKGRLEAEGIPAFVQHEHHIWAKWTISLAIGYVRVQVNRDDLDDSFAIIRRLDAGEFALVDEEEHELSRCPTCNSANIVRVNWSWKLALLGAMFLSILIPYTVFRVKCIECKHSWTQKELRGYPVWIAAFAILLIFSGYLFLIEVLYYLCRINGWNDVCTISIF